MNIGLRNTKVENNLLIIPERLDNTYVSGRLSFCDRNYYAYLAFLRDSVLTDSDSK